MSRLPRLSPIRVVVILAAAMVAYLIFSAGGNYLHSRQLRSDERGVRQEIVQLQRQHRELLAVRDYLLSDEYVEGVARRILGLVRPGETLVLVSSTDAAATPTPGAGQESEPPPAQDGRPWWERLFGP